MGFDLGHLMKVRLTSLGNEDDDLNLTMRKEKRGEAHCLKITKKCRINTASEASDVYNSSGQKLILASLQSNSVTRQVTFNRTKIDMRHF